MTSSNLQSDKVDSYVHSCHLLSIFTETLSFSQTWPKEFWVAGAASPHAPKLAGWHIRNERWLGLVYIHKEGELTIIPSCRRLRFLEGLAHVAWKQFQGQENPSLSQLNREPPEYSS